MPMTTLLSDHEVTRIAEELTAKYGLDVLEFTSARAARAVAIGDQLAYAAWRAVRVAAEELLLRMVTAAA
jgi:hypothetical protein